MLIAFEGIDGSGKSTQAHLLTEWLGDRAGQPQPFLTQWNSSPFVKPALKEAKKQRALTPTTFALLEAADMADRYDREISPALAEGRIVIADRWVYTAFARGMARGLDAAWLRGVYSFAPKPDFCFHLNIPVDLALERIQRFRPVKHYEAGMDVGLSQDPAESFLEFQGVGAAAYAGMQLAEGCFMEVDARLSAEEQHLAIRSAIEATREHAAGVRTASKEQFDKAHEKVMAEHAGLFRRLAK